MSDIMIAVTEAVSIANNNKHGYSQADRNGKPDYDCSSLVIHCLDAAGYPMSKNGASYTGNMVPALKKCGFKNVTKKINLRTGKGMLPGDVFLNPGKHTAIAVSTNKMVAAHSNYDKKPGDSSGKEINVYQYKPYSKGWETVWRASDEPGKLSDYEMAYHVLKGLYGNGKERKKRLKAAGYDPETVQTAVNNILKYKEVVDDVLADKYGTGEDRKKALEKEGLPYDIIQSIINAYLKGVH